MKQSEFKELVTSKTMDLLNADHFARLQRISNAMDNHVTMQQAQDILTDVLGRMCAICVSGLDCKVSEIDSGIAPSFILLKIDHVAQQNIDSVVSAAITEMENTLEKENEAKAAEAKKIAHNYSSTSGTSITAYAWSSIRKRLGIVAGRPSYLELAYREVFQPIITDRFEQISRSDELGPLDYSVCMNVVDEELDRCFADPEYLANVETKRKALTRSTTKVYAKKNTGFEDVDDDASSAVPRSAPRPKKDMDMSLEEKFISVPRALLTSDSIVTSSIGRLTKKDIMEIFSKGMPSLLEANYLVDLYYTFQHNRIALAAQKRSALSQANPFYTIAFFHNEFDSIESQVKNVLDVYTDADPIGWTLKQVVGVGPVIAAGLISTLKIERGSTAGSFWRYAGIDPTLPKPTKGEKHRYNATLKTLVVFKLGESFIKVQNKPTAVYGAYYKKWKQVYVLRNERGEYAEYAKKQLETVNYGKDTTTYECYMEGKLPPGQIHNRARIKPVAMFLSHVFELMYRVRYHCREPKPWVFEHGDGQHVDWFENPLIGIYEAKYGKIPLDQEPPKTLLRDTRGTPINYNNVSSTN